MTKYKITLKVFVAVIHAVNTALSTVKNCCQTLKVHIIITFELVRRDQDKHGQQIER